MLKVLFHNCQEASNIGNGFFYRSLKKMLSDVGQGDIALYDGQDLPHMVWRDIRGYRKENVFYYGMYGDVDAFVFSGPMVWNEVTNHYGPYFKKIRKNWPNAKLIFMNLGGMIYDEVEREKFLLLMSELKPYAITCRDQPTYELLKDSCPRTHRGIDAGFFLSKLFQPYDTPDLGSYSCLCFDHSNEPIIKYDTRVLPAQAAHTYLSADLLNAALTIKPLRISKKLRPYIEKFRKHSVSELGRLIIRPQHGLIDVSATQIFCKPNTFISEQAMPYVNLYAGSDYTVSDRVHSCVATLSFGSPARLITKTGRASLFDRVNLSDIRDRFVTLDMDMLDREYEDYMHFLKTLVSDLKNELAR